jgi:hypothetical protein
MSRHFILVILLAVSTSAVFAAAGDPGGFVTRFDGRSLDGWTRVHSSGPGCVVEDGLLVCPADRGGSLMTTQECSDFRLDSGCLASPDNRPPKGFQALFNGKDLTGWKGLVADPPKRARTPASALAEAQAQADRQMREHWTAIDGVLTYDGKGTNLCTAREYGDFELLVDWKISPGGDSGIYLRGSPQVQIWDRAEGSGGLYNNQKNPSQPTHHADRPVGEWNRFRIVMIGEKVTVYLNGERVVDQVTMENYWERDKPIYPTGSIELQHHGDRLYFKNLFIREIPRGAGAASQGEPR